MGCFLAFLGNSLPSARDNFQMISYGKNVLAIGGEEALVDYSNEIFELPCDEDDCGQWTLKSYFSTGRRGHVAMIIQDFPFEDHRECLKRSN